VAGTQRTQRDAHTKGPTHRGLGEYLRVIGPGLVTGASDDDPSGIATYAQAGAQFRFGLLWLTLVSLPLMSGVQVVVAVINGIAAAPFLVVIMMISSDRTIMGELRNGRLATALGWLTAAIMAGAALLMIMSGGL
jgi:Mn2+/Fe2+ NRAMP family transporter